MENDLTRDRLWSEDELKQLILYAKDLQETNETLRAQLIAMNAKLGNEEAKVRQLRNTIKLFTNGTGNFS